MLLRTAHKSEKAAIFQMGFKEWAKGRIFTKYVEDNKKEDEYGTRYVYVDDKNNIIGSFIVLSFYLKKDKTIFGIGSIVISREYQGKGYGKKMLHTFFSTNNSATFMLYSDIDPDYYHPFNFRKLPPKLQHYTHSIFMIRCTDSQYEEICATDKAQIPSYF